MSDKFLAGFLAAIVLLPACILCALGPVALIAAGAGILAWIGGYAT